MEKPTRISVIISSYNWPPALDVVLRGLGQQSCRDFEVVVADDGSHPEALAAIRRQIDAADFPARLVWQEDQGFRAAKARNQAVAQAEGDYLVFLDGDCVPRSDFITQHDQLAEPGYWVSGNRVLLSENFTKEALTSADFQVNCRLSYWLKQRFQGACNRFLPLLYWPLAWGRKMNRLTWKGAKTCNLGVWKTDFLRVNGFDERYQGWGYEDSDLVIRLIRSGVYRKSGRFAVPVFHLWHPENNRDQQPENLARLEMIRSSTEQVAALGIDQYL